MRSIQCSITISDKILLVYYRETTDYYLLTVGVTCRHSKISWKLASAGLRKSQHVSICASVTKQLRCNIDTIFRCRITDTPRPKLAFNLSFRNQQIGQLASGNYGE